MAHKRPGPDSPMDAPEKSRNTCRPWTGTLRFRPQLQIKTWAPADTAEESPGAPHDLRGDWISLRPQERVPEVPTVTREEPGLNSRRNRRFSPQR